MSPEPAPAPYHNKPVKPENTKITEKINKLKPVQQQQIQNRSHLKLLKIIMHHHKIEITTYYVLNHFI